MYTIVYKKKSINKKTSDECTHYVGAYISISSPCTHLPPSALQSKYDGPFSTLCLVITLRYSTMLCNGNGRGREGERERGERDRQRQREGESKGSIANDLRTYIVTKSLPSTSSTHTDKQTHPLIPCHLV